MEKVSIQISKELYTKTIKDIMNVLKRQDKQIKELKNRLDNL